MPEVKILTEAEITTRPALEVEVKQIMVTYQLEGHPPRAVWIDKEQLPDLMYFEANPDATTAPEEEIKRGDLVRLKAIWDDQAELQKRRVKRPFSY